MPGITRPTGTGAPSKTTTGRATAPKSKVVTDKRDIFEQDAKDGQSMRYSCICLSLIGFMLLAFGLTLIIVGSVVTVQDLIIVGALFAIGGLVFVFLLILNVCRPLCTSNSVGVTDIYKESEDYMRKSTINLDEEYSRQPYVSGNSDIILPQKQPPPAQLYSNYNTTSPLPPPTPATATDVHMDTDSYTPPPPRALSPTDPALKSAAVYNLPVSKKRKPGDSNITNLELK